MNSEMSVDQQENIHDNLELLSHFLTEPVHRVNDSE